jgi:hypothetical protein
MVSYYHWLKGQGFDHPAVVLAKELSFPDFVQHPQTLKSFKAAPYSSYLSFRGQDCGSCYIRIEHFEEDAEALFAHLGFSLTLDLVNASAREKDYRGYYDTKTRETLAEACAADIARFSYRF